PWRAPRLWRPLPASLAGGAGARPDHPISGHSKHSLDLPTQTMQWKRGIIPPLHEMTPNRRVTRANHIERRKFLATLGGAAAAWPVGARTQQPKVPTIGALVIGNISPEQFWREFRQGLRDLGYVEGQNIRFEFRSAEGHLDRLPELAAELVRLKVDII